MPGSTRSTSPVLDVTITPVAFHDPALLNNVGVHEPFALRSVVEVRTGDGVVGLGESYGDTEHLQRLHRAVPHLLGVDVFDLHAVGRAVAASLGGAASRAGDLLGQVVQDAADRVLSPFEVACLDAQGKLTGRPVSDLLGGAVRDEVAYSAYAFYKWAAHPGGEEDGWGAALDPAGIVAQVRRMVDEHGFTAVKLKGGVFPPQEEIEAVRALRAEFPDLPLRLDPNGAWTPDTSVRVAEELDGVLEYLEDPTPGIPGWRRCRGGSRAGCRWPPTCASSPSRTCRPPWRRTPSRSSCPTTTTGAGCAGRRTSAASARSSASACRCTPTPTSGSAWPP